MARSLGKVLLHLGLEERAKMNLQGRGRVPLLAKAKAYEHASDLAASYDARMKALEEVARLARQVIHLPMFPSGDIETTAVHEARGALILALAALPSEKKDE